MLTRVRFEAEGGTIQDVQDTLFAAHDALLAVAYGEHVIAPVRLTDEVYELADPPSREYTRWYRGRAVLLWDGDQGPVDADRLRPRIEFLQRADEAALGRAGPGPIISPPGFTGIARVG